MWELAIAVKIAIKAAYHVELLLYVGVIWLMVGRSFGCASLHITISSALSDILGNEIRETASTKRFAAPKLDMHTFLLGINELNRDNVL